MARVLILDSEAVSALAEQREGMAERLAAAQQGDHRVVIPAVVLAEVATGAPTDAAIWHVLGRIPTLDLPQGVAMRAGALRARADKARRKKGDLQSLGCDPGLLGGPGSRAKHDQRVEQQS